MLPNTLTLAAGIVFTKLYEDKQAGSQYKLDSSSNLHPTLLNVRQDVPGIGKTGVARHLLSVSMPILATSTAAPTTDRVTVNITVTHPMKEDRSETEIATALRFAIAAMLQASPDAAPISTAFDSATDFGPMFLASHI